MEFLAGLIVFLTGIGICCITCAYDKREEQKKKRWSTNQLFCMYMGVFALAAILLGLTGINPLDYYPPDPLEQIEKLEKRITELEKAK